MFDNTTTDFFQGIIYIHLVIGQCILNCSIVKLVRYCFPLHYQYQMWWQIVRRIDQFIRKRAFTVRPEVLKVFMSLRIKNVESLDAQIEATLNTKRKLTHKEKLVKKLMEKRQHKKSKRELKVRFSPSHYVKGGHWRMISASVNEFSELWYTVDIFCSYFIYKISLTSSERSPLFSSGVTLPLGQYLGLRANLETAFWKYEYKQSYAYYVLHTAMVRLQIPGLFQYPD